MSTTALVPIADMQVMAQAIAKSGLFGIKTADQCLALMLIAHAEGKHPAIVARDYDVIQGRPAKKSEAMLRDFLEAGGKVQWHAMTDDLADATFSHAQGGEVRISWDLARAKRAGLTGKDNYQKYSRQMLASRTISEGCRRVYPACTSGLYEPGEVRQIAKEDKQIEKDMGKAEVVKEEDWTTGIPTESAAPQVSQVSGIASSEKPAASPAAAAPNPIGQEMTEIAKTARVGTPTFINADQAIALEDRCKEVKVTVATFCKQAKIERISQLLASRYDGALAWLDSHDKALQS